MSASGKKNKTKWKPVDAAQILNPSAPRKTTSSWADEAEEYNDNMDYGRKSAANVTLPTAPRAARAPEMEANIPREPPFQAYLTNLSYDATEEDLADFFSALKVKSVRLPRDDRGNSRARGFGYVEFEDRNSLIEALSMPDLTCKNRRMRIEVAENGDMGRGGRGGPRDRDRNPNEPDRTQGDWRSGPRSEADPPPDRDGFRSGPRREYGNDRGGGFESRGGGGGFRDDYRSRDGGGFRDRGGFRDDRGGGGFRDDRGGGGFRDDRGGGGFRDDRGGGGFRDDRGGGGFREDRGGGGFRDDRGGGGFRDDRGGGGFRDRDRGGYRDDRDRGFRDDDRGRMDDRDRRGGGDFGGDRGTWRRDPEPNREPPPERREEPKTRQKLNLQPRTKPVEEVVAAPAEAPAPAPAATPAPAPPSAASIFGKARPVDTAAREREIEERLVKQREEKPAEKPVGSSREPRSTSESKEDAPAANHPPLEPAPPPKENAWARRSQQTNSSQENNGRISPHEDRDSDNKHADSNNEPRKYQAPRGRPQDDRRRDDRGPPPSRGGGPPRGGGAPRNSDTRQAPPSKPKEPRKEPSDEIRMPKVQEHTAPNFVASNKYAFLEENE